MSPQKPVHHMETRLKTLESDVTGIKASMAVINSDIQEIKTSVGALAGLSGQFQSFVAKHEATKPPSYTTILGTIVTTGILVGMFVSALFFLIDARVSAAVHESSSFTQEWKKDGRLYVTLYDLNQRMTTIEKQLSWKAELVAIQPSSSPSPSMRR